MTKGFKYVTGIGVVAMCLVLAYYLQFTDIMFDRVYGTRRTIIVVMLAVYSVFRIIRLVLAYKKDKLNEKNSEF